MYRAVVRERCLCIILERMTPPRLHEDRLRGLSYTTLLLTIAVCEVLRPGFTLVEAREPTLPRVRSQEPCNFPFHSAKVGLQTLRLEYELSHFSYTVHTLVPKKCYGRHPRRPAATPGTT